MRQGDRRAAPGQDDSPQPYWELKEACFGIGDGVRPSAPTLQLFFLILNSKFQPLNQNGMVKGDGVFFFFFITLKPRAE